MLMDQYCKVLFGTAYLMTRDYGLAQDAVQEALIRAWRGMPSFRPYGSFKSWLVRILINVAQNQRRKKQIQTVPLEEAIAVAGNPGEPEDVVLEEEERQRLKRAVKTLREDYREAVVLRYYADLTVPEIAKALGWREGTVKSRLYRARALLRGALSVEDAQPGLEREG